MAYGRFKAAAQRSRLSPSLFRAPRLRDNTASVDDLRFKAAELRVKPAACKALKRR